MPAASARRWRIMRAIPLASPSLSSVDTAAHRQVVDVQSLHSGPPGSRGPPVALQRGAPMYGPAVRRKRFHRSGGFVVLHQCIRPLIGAVCAPGHHGYQRACILITGRASNGPNGSPGFAGAGKTGPPFRFILSQTSAGKWGTMSSLSPDRCSSFVRAVRPGSEFDRGENCGRRHAAPFLCSQHVNEHSGVCIATV